MWQSFGKRLQQAILRRRERESRGRERRRIVGTSNEEEGNDDDQGKCKKVVGDRRKISSEDLAKVKSGEALDGGLVFVGEFDLRRARLEVGQSILDETGWKPRRSGQEV